MHQSTPRRPDIIPSFKSAQLPIGQIPQEQFPRRILVADATRTSLTCHEEIGRVGRGCYEDASDLSVTSRACRARIWRTTRQTDKRAALPQLTAIWPIAQIPQEQFNCSIIEFCGLASYSYTNYEDVARVERVRMRMIRGNCCREISAYRQSTTFIPEIHWPAANTPIYSLRDLFPGAIKGTCLCKDHNCVQ